MKRVTHVCMDRPIVSSDKSKEYVQPQYIVDSINNLFLLPTKPYLPGIAAPAHLSPFIDNEAEGYMPDRQREINSLAGIESNVAGPTAFGGHDSSDEEEKDEEAKAAELAAGKAKKDKGDIDSSSDEEGKSEELSDSEDEEEVSKVKKGPGAKKAAPAKKIAPKAAKKIQK